MKKIVWILKLFIPCLILGGVIISFAGVPRWIRPAARPEPEMRAPEKNTVYSPEEEAKLRQLILVYAHMDSCRKLYTTGTMNTSDPSDSTGNMHSAFSFCRNENELYYQVGDAEMVALKDIYISISRSAKKIFVGPPRKVLPPFQFPADSLVQVWKSEHYSVEGDTSGAGATLRLLNPTHIACKEYRFEYNPVTMALKSQYMKLTSLADPFNDKLDKEVRIVVNRWQEGNIPDMLLRKEHYLKSGKNGWEPAGAYSGYTLIPLF